MAHIVTERCVNSRYTDCCTVCPADCFFEVADPEMLVIDPNTCIDCGLCIAECPIQAIWPEDELPEEYAEWAQKNADLAPTGTLVNSQKDPDNQANLSAIGFKSHVREDMAPPLIWLIFFFVLLETFVSGRISLKWGAR